MPRARYDVHPAVDHTAAMLRSLPDRTGHSIDDWIRLLQRQKLEDAKAERAWLRSEHQLGGPTANLIVDISAGEGGDFSDEKTYLAAAPKYVDAMYAGKKAHLRPLHDRLVELARDLGDDIRISPCRTMVPVYRAHVIAQIKPSTQTRIDLGLALKKAKRKPTKRLIDTGGAAKGDRITHRIPLLSLDDIDDDVRTWLETAYEADA